MIESEIVSSEPLIRLPTDVQLKEEVLGDPVPRVITDFILPDSKNAILRFLPVLIWGILGGIGAIIFLIQPNMDIEAVSEWLFYIVMLIISPYLLKFIKKKMNDTMEYAHKVTQISKEDHLKLKRGLLGPFGVLGIIAVIGFTLLFGLWDYNGLFMAGNEENWVFDVVASPEFYANGIMAVPFLLVWEFGWLFISQFLWFAISFVIYIFRIIRKYSYREEPQIVVKLGLSKPLSQLIVSTGYGFVPFLILRFFLQLVFQIIWPDYTVWMSDTVATTITLILFLLLTIVPPLIIAADLKKEVAEETRKAEILGITAIENVVEKAKAQGGVPINEAVSALLFNTYLQQMKEKQKTEGGLQKKMVTSAAGPIASYGAKTGIKYVPL